MSQVLQKAKKILQEEHGIKMITSTEIYVKNSEDHQCYTSAKSFADDLTAIIASLTEAQNKIALKVLQDLYIEYFAEVGLKVNIEKNEHIVLSTSPRADTNFIISGRAEKSQVKLLGLTFKNGWNTEPHISNLASRTSYRMAGIARLKPYLTGKQIARLLDALVMSLLRYALELTSSSRANLYKLQIIQNRALRMATNALKTDKISDMLKLTGWQSVTNILRTQQIKLVKW